MYMYGTGFVQGGWSLLPEYFLQRLPENQVFMPEYYLHFLTRKLSFDKFGGGGGEL